MNVKRQMLVWNPAQAHSSRLLLPEAGLKNNNGQGSDRNDKPMNAEQKISSQGTIA